MGRGATRPSLQNTMQRAPFKERKRGGEARAEGGAVLAFEHALSSSATSHNSVTQERGDFSCPFSSFGSMLIVDPCFAII